MNAAGSETAPDHGKDVDEKDHNENHDNNDAYPLQMTLPLH